MGEDSFGALIRERRRRLNRSLQEVADALGVTPVYVSEVERRRRPPFTIERLPALARVLEMNIQELTVAAWRERKMIELDPAASDKQIQALVALARGGLSENQLEEILKIVNKPQLEIF